MTDEPTRSGAHSGPPGGNRAERRSRSADGAPAAPLTVAELLARSGTGGTRRRRAERRESGEATGRQQPVGDDGRPGDPPPLQSGIRGGAAPSAGTPSVLPTGWQPAMPTPHAEPPADEPGRRTSAPRVEGPAERPARGFRPPAPQTPAPRPLNSQPPTARPPAAGSPAAGSPAAQPSAAQPPAGPPSVPPRPVMRAVPGEAPSAEPTPAPATPPLPAPSSSAPLPPFPGGPSTPYASVPVPGVRRSLPLPPIPGRDLPVTGSGDAPTPAPVRAPVSPARRRLTRAALALVAVLTVVAAYYVGLYFYVDRSMDRVDALVVDGPEVLAPQLQESAQTYLVVGTGLPGRSGESAVSTLIAHVSAGGDQAVLVSVPPTALNDTPTCRDSAGDVRPAVTETFASALRDGGPSCLVRSVQQLTGLRVDHYLAVDLGRLPGLVDALGGVSVCLPEPSAATGAELPLPPGVNRLSGDDVVGYLRPGGIGSDVSGAAAAQREQLVLTSTLRTALAGGTLADPLTLTRFLSRASGAFTVDADSTIGDVRALGATLGRLPSDAVERTQLPVAQVGYVPAGTDRAVLVVDATGTRKLFDAVIDEGRLPAAAVTAAPDAQAAGGGAAAGQPGAADSLPDPALTDPVPEGTTVTVPPAGVTVDVLDATGGDRSAEVADGLAAGGFRIGSRGSEPAAVDRTIVRYGPATLEPARTVAAAVPGAVLLETDEVGGAVQLVIGADFTGLAPVDLGTPVPTTAAPASVGAEAGAASSCS